MTVVYGSKSILLLSASFMFWLGGTDQFQSDSVWYWISTEQAINDGYTDWHATEPDHPGDTTLQVFRTRSLTGFFLLSRCKCYVCI